MIYIASSFHELKVLINNYQCEVIRVKSSFLEALLGDERLMRKIDQEYTRSITGGIMHLIKK